jgi:hypothetical protein
VGVFEVFASDGIRSNNSRDANGTYTVSSVNACAFKKFNWRAYAAPNESIAITASFFFVSILTLSTIGMGRTRMTTSAITSVYYSIDQPVFGGFQIVT